MCHKDNILKTNFLVIFVFLKKKKKIQEKDYILILSQDVSGFTSSLDLEDNLAIFKSGLTQVNPRRGCPWYHGTPLSLHFLTYHFIDSLNQEPLCL